MGSAHPRSTSYTGENVAEEQPTDEIVLNTGAVLSGPPIDPSETLQLRLLNSSATVGPQNIFHAPVTIHTDRGDVLDRLPVVGDIGSDILGSLMSSEQGKCTKNRAEKSDGTKTTNEKIPDDIPENTQESLVRKYLGPTFCCSALRLFQQNRKTKILTGCVIAALLLIIIILPIALIGNSTNLDSYDYLESLNAGLKNNCSSLTLLPRQKWKAVHSTCPPLKVKVQKYQFVKTVVISDTNTPKCRVENKCAEKVKDLQADHQNRLGLCDIRYNFLIGGVNSVFVIEGKGFSHQEKNDPLFTAKDLKLQIGLIGTFPEGRPTNLETAALCFIDVAKSLGFLNQRSKIEQDQTNDEVEKAN